MGADDEQFDDVLVPVEQDTIMFYGHPLVAVRLADGRICAVLRWLCDGLRLDPSGQVRRIRRKTALAIGLVYVRVETGGGPQVMPALTLHVLSGWFYTIDESRIKDEARPDVIKFQLECTDALAEHFEKKARQSTQIALPPSTIVPSAQPRQPERPAPDAGLSAWLDYHRGMVTLLEWREDVERWRKEQERRVEAVELRQDTLEDRMEGVEELSRLFVEVTERLGPRTLTPEHQATVKRMAGRLHELSGMSFAAIYGELNEMFHTGKYSDIAEADWERVSEWFCVRIAGAERRQKH